MGTDCWTRRQQLHKTYPARSQGYDGKLHRIGPILYYVHKQAYGKAERMFFRDWAVTRPKEPKGTSTQAWLTLSNPMASEDTAKALGDLAGFFFNHPMFPSFRICSWSLESPKLPLLGSIMDENREQEVTLYPGRIRALESFQIAEVSANGHYPLRNSESVATSLSLCHSVNSLITTSPCSFVVLQKKIHQWCFPH